MTTEAVQSRSTALLARIHALWTVLESLAPLWIILLASRVAVGAVFFRSGLLKTDNWPLTLLLFRDEYKVPLLSHELAAMVATGVELSMPVLLFAGLLSRLAALPLLGMTLVIQIFVYPNAWSEHLLWATLLVIVFTRGPGMLSLDRLLGIERRSP